MRWWVCVVGTVAETWSASRGQGEKREMGWLVGRGWCVGMRERGTPQAGGVIVTRLGAAPLIPRRRVGTQDAPPGAVEHTKFTPGYTFRCGEAGDDSPRPATSARRPRLSARLGAWHLNRRSGRTGPASPRIYLEVRGWIGDGDGPRSSAASSEGILMSISLMGHEESKRLRGQRRGSAGWMC